MVENEVSDHYHQETGTSHHPPLLSFVNGEKDGHEEKGGEKVSQQGKKKGIDDKRGYNAGPSPPSNLPQERFFLFILPESDPDQVEKGKNPRRSPVPKGRNPDPGSEGVPTFSWMDATHKAPARASQKRQVICSALRILAVGLKPPLCNRSDRSDPAKRVMGRPYGERTEAEFQGLILCSFRKSL